MLAWLVDVTDFRLSRNGGENRVGGYCDVDACACAFVRAREHRFERQAKCAKERDVATVGRLPSDVENRRLRQLWLHV